MLSTVVRFFIASPILVMAIPPANSVKTAPRVSPAIQLPPSEFPYGQISIYITRDKRSTYLGSCFSNKDSHDDHDEKSIQPCVRAELDEEIEVSLCYNSSDPLNSRD